MSSDSKNDTRSNRKDDVYNVLSLEAIDALIDSLLKKNGKKEAPVKYNPRLQCYETTLQPTKNKRGEDKYVQVTIPTGSLAFNELKSKGFVEPTKQKKLLLHILCWRLQNKGAPLPPNQEISHRHKNPKVMLLVAESPEMNESRKYCHMFGWCHCKPNEDTPRCPHREAPCRCDACPNDV